MNVFKYIYPDWRHPIHTIIRFWRCLGYFFQRGLRGYADIDLVDLDIFYYNLFVDTLLAFRNKTDGYPQEYGSLEVWKSKLLSIAVSFYVAIEESNVYKNPYDIDKDPKKWVEEDKRLMKRRKQDVEAGFDMLKKVVPNLWL